MSREFTNAKWVVEDVHYYRKQNNLPEWNNDQAEKWLQNYESKLEEVMVEAGWLVFEEML